jgi:hypothetical protein
VSGSWKGILAVGGAVGLGVVAGLIALNVRSGRESAPAGPVADAGSASVVTVYKSPT